MTDKLIRIEAMLKIANGSMRERTINILDIVRVVEDARDTGYSWITGGMITVNAYQWQAWTAAFVAIKIAGSIYVRANRINAKGSPVSWWGPNNKSEATCRAWVDSFRNWPLTKHDMEYFQCWTKLTPVELKSLRSLQKESAA